MRIGLGSDLRDLVTEFDDASEVESMCLELVSRSFVSPEQESGFKGAILSVLSRYLSDNNHRLEKWADVIFPHFPILAALCNYHPFFQLNGFYLKVWL